MGTLREALEASMTKSGAAGDESEVEVEQEEPAAENVEASSEAEPGTVEEPAAEEAPEGEVAAAAGDRDERGRFRAKPGDQEQQAAGGQQRAKPAAETVPDATAAAPAALKAPSSWKPAAREAFAKAPREVQEEAVRIDQHVRQVMQESAGARQFAQVFQQTIAPFEAMIRAEQRGRPYNPIAAAASLFQTAAALRTGGPLQKADLVADIIQTYGIPIEVLDKAIAKRIKGGAGEEADPGQEQPNGRRPAAGEFRDPRLDQLLEQRQQEQEQRQQELYDQGTADVDAFKGKAEFFDDVRADMGLLMEAATRANEPMSLQEAYDTALALPKHKAIQGILKQRADAAAVKQKAAANKKARAASSSVRTNPTGGASAATEPANLRSVIEEKWEEAQSRS